MPTSNQPYFTSQTSFKKTKEFKKLEKIKAKDIDYFENNYKNLIYTTKTTDWTYDFERKFESDPMYPRLHFMLTLTSRLRVNLRRKIQKLCANKVKYLLTTENKQPPLKSKKIFSKKIILQLGMVDLKNATIFSTAWLHTVKDKIFSMRCKTAQHLKGLRS